jgi:hypothetical protein
LNSAERAASGYTHLFKLVTADFSGGFSNVQLALLALNIGDAIYNRSLVEVRTAVTGPTGAPTVSLGVTSALTQCTPTVAVNATGYAVPGGSQEAYVTVASSKSLTVDCQVGGGNGAAATAGEIWIWVALSLVADRLQIQS